MPTYLYNQIVNDVRSGAAKPRKDITFAVSTNRNNNKYVKQNAILIFTHCIQKSASCTGCRRQPNILFISLFNERVCDERQFENFN